MREQYRGRPDWTALGLSALILAAIVWHTAEDQFQQQEKLPTTPITGGPRPIPTPKPTPTPEVTVVFATVTPTPTPRPTPEPTPTPTSSPTPPPTQKG